MNKRRLLKLADLLEADAKNKKGVKFDLSTWGNSVVDKNPVSVSCGTLACAMGLAAISGAFEREGLFNAYGDESWAIMPAMKGGGRGIEAACELFRIDEPSAQFLFYSDYYPLNRCEGAAAERKCATCHAILADGPQPAATYAPTTLPRDAERETIEALQIAAEYEAGTAKAVATGYEEFGPAFQRQRQIIIDALRFYACHVNPGAAMREPTEAMLNAARDWSREKYGKPIGNDGAIGCWQAMLAALPSIPRPLQSTTEQADASRDHPVREVNIDRVAAAIMMAFIKKWFLGTYKGPVYLDCVNGEKAWGEEAEAAIAALSPFPTSVMPDEGK